MRDERDSEEASCGGYIPVGGDVHLDHLATLVDRPVDVAPGAARLHIGLVNEPAAAAKRMTLGGNR